MLIKPFMEALTACPMISSVVTLSGKIFFSENRYSLRQGYRILFLSDITSDWQISRYATQVIWIYHCHLCISLILVLLIAAVAQLLKYYIMASLWLAAC